MCATADIPLELERSVNGKSQKRLAGCWLVMLEGQTILLQIRLYTQDDFYLYNNINSCSVKSAGIETVSTYTTDSVTITFSTSNNSGNAYGSEIVRVWYR